MNINKKYKKWLLGLVTPVLALAPMALISSCSSSSNQANQEKADYEIWFKRQKGDDITSVTIETNKYIGSITEIKQEIINNKEKVFNVKGNKNILTDEFLNRNLWIVDRGLGGGVILGLFNAGSNERIDTGAFYLKYPTSGQVDLRKHQYKIDFTSSASEKPVINLNDKLISNVLPSLWTDQDLPSFLDLDIKYITKLITEDSSIKNQILTISGPDVDKITNEVLRAQIIKVSLISNPNDKDGTLEVELTIKSPENGGGDDIKKTFIFRGFDKLDNYTIWFDKQINENNNIEINTKWNPIRGATQAELKQEIFNNINNKEKLLNNIKGNKNILTDEFLNNNLFFNWNQLIIKNASPKGGQIAANIEWKYEEPDLSQYQYKIDFTSSASEKPVINLDDKLISNILPTAFWPNRLHIIKSILENPSIKNQILTISGPDADKITNDVLRGMIDLWLAQDGIISDNNGTAELELRISPPDENGGGGIKTFIFTGFHKLEF